MKKYLFIIMFLGLLCFLFIGCKHNKDVLAEQELSNLKAKDITSFQITLRPPNKEITVTDDENISDLIKILNKVIMYEQDDSYNEYIGQWVEFELSMADGSSKNIVAYNPFIVINGIGYKTEYEPCEALNKFGNSFID